jgi:hypothetical protein
MDDASLVLQAGKGARSGCRADSGDSGHCTSRSQAERVLTKRCENEQLFSPDIFSSWDEAKGGLQAFEVAIGQLPPMTVVRPNAESRQ